MTSPVDTSVKFFSSLAPGAPTFAAQPGQLIALLDACLVDGFGALSLTSLTVSAGVATAAFAGTFPALPETVVTIAGATGAYSVLNGEQKVTAVGSGTFSFATAAAGGAAAGTLTAKVSPAGWEKRFTGTNLAVYRTLDTTGNRFNLRVNDANGLDARVVGYETMTAISTGTNLFPTNTQQSGGGWWLKGLTADTNPLPWFVIANGKRFWFGIAHGASPNYGTATYDAMSIKGFGEFLSLKTTSTDAYNTALFSAPNTGSYYPSMSVLGTAPSNAAISIARLHTNAVGAQFGMTLSVPNTNYDSGEGGPGGWGPLDGIHNKLILSNPRIGIDVQQYGLRGIYKELWQTPQKIPGTALNLNFGDLVLGVDQAAGRKLIAVPGRQQAGAATLVDTLYRTFFDVTGPWE